MGKLITDKASNVMSMIINKKNSFSIKFTKKLIIIFIIILILLAVFKVVNVILANQGLEENKYTVLNVNSNINKINVKGEIKSDKTTNVYSNVVLPIKQINVEVGDRVKAGDVLAILDTSKLEDQINELEATISTTDASNEVALENAKAAYDNALALSSDENNEEIKSAAAALKSAELDYENKNEMYVKYKQLYESGAITEEQLNEYKISYENSQETYNNYKVALDNAKAKVQLDLTTAKNNYDAAKIKCEDNSQHISLDNLKKDLNNTVITAPVDGIISVKNVSVGSSTSGVSLFEIEDENNINATVDIKEVDVEKVKEGQAVQLKTDATGSDIINGNVISVKPIAKVEDTNQLELNDDSNDKEAEYEVKIKMTDSEYKLKLGMKVKADIILEEDDEVYIVPSESVIKDKDNNDCLYIADKQGKDYVVKEIPVTKGTENDLNVEVSGDDIKDGVIVLNSPSEYEVGSTIKIKDK